MIKNPLHFIIGIICLFCFIFNVINHRDAFCLVITGVAAFTNILIGLYDEE